jgi:predicted Zn-dependent peptidase
MEEYRKTLLPNGLRIVTEWMPHVRSVAVGVWVDTGSRNERPGRGGISHLIEHLVFKGTTTRSAQDIARAMDAVGGQMDAFTTKEHTCFYVQVLDQHLPMAVNLLTDILLNPLFDPDELEREKSVVLQEIRMVEDTPDDLVHELFAGRMWAGHPLALPILGDRDEVAGYGAGTVREHFVEEYVPERIIVAVAGNVTHDQVVELFWPRFDRFTARAAARETTRPVPHDGVDITTKNLEQVHLVAGFPGLPHTAPERYAQYLLNDILGGSMSSRLFQEVRERQGLVYSIYSGTQSYQDAGLLYVYAATDATNFSKMVKSVLHVMRALKKDGVTAEELAHAKDHLKGSLMLSLESTSSRMNRLARQELHFGSFFTIDAMLAAIDSVRVEDLQALVTDLLDEGRLMLVTLGPLDRRNLPRELLRH